MDTKQQLREALADLMAVDGLYDVQAIKNRVVQARANVRRVFQRLDGVVTGSKVIGIREKEVAHG